MHQKKHIKRLMLYDPEFSSEAAAFVREDPGNNVAMKLKSLAELTNAIESSQGVEYLLVNTHGGPGEIQLADGVKITASSFILPSLHNPDFLRPGAQVLFEGCSVGKGANGDKFIDDSAQYLLKGKGGAIGASTSDTANLGTWTLVPPWGDLKRYEYDSTGKRTKAVVKNALRSRLDL